MASPLYKFIGIMLFYIFLSYVVFPFIFFNSFGKTYKAAGNGFIVGSIVSILLWLFVGSKMM